MDIERALRRNIKELQLQLQRAYERIKTLQTELESERRRNSNLTHFKSGISGWALMEDPDVRENIKEPVMEKPKNK